MNSTFTLYPSPDQVILTLVWAMFGLGDKEDVTPSGDADQVKTSTEIVGTTLYVIYHFMLVIVMLNMLIAMMATSFQEIHVSS